MIELKENEEKLNQGEYRLVGCYLVINIKTGKVLITQSLEEQKLGEWAFPQGGFESPNESLSDNVYRELGEEAGIKSSEIMSLNTSFHSPFHQEFSQERIEKEQAKGRNYIGKKYFPVKVEYNGEETLAVSSEIANYQWVDIATAKELLAKNSGKGANLCSMLSVLG